MMGWYMYKHADTGCEIMEINGDVWPRCVQEAVAAAESEMLYI